MNRFFFLSVLTITALTANSQITKRNWMIDGNALVSSLNNSSAATAQFKQTDIQINAGIGYFVQDKFAIGVRPLLTYGSNNIGNSSTVFSFGPFVRYYFLKSENIINIVTEISYTYGVISGGTKSNTLAIYTGPVIYFNSSVGLEFLLGYSASKIVGFNGKNNKLQFGIGFQFHLEKEK